MYASDYELTIKTAIQHKEHASVIALGPPGIGKTAIPIAVCKKLKVPYSILRLNLVNPSDIRGMAYIAEVEKEDGTREKTAIWAWPGMLPKDDGRIHVVILDDVTNSPTTVQSTAYGMVLEHSAGEHDLSHIRFISTGNRIEDASGAYALSAALLNRFERINLIPDLEETRSYAIRNGWDPMIPAFWKFKPEALHSFDANSARNAEPFPSPRSWDLLNTTLSLYPSVGVEKIGNYIGQGTALEFRSFMQLKDQLPNPKDIITGKIKKLPKNTESDIMYALTGSLVSYYVKHTSNLGVSKKQAIENLLVYAEKLPAEYSVMLVLDLSKQDMETLRKAPSWKKWATGKAKYILDEVK